MDKTLSQMECDNGNGAVITINKQLYSYLDSTGLADLPQMTEQLNNCLARGDPVNIKLPTSAH